MTNASSRLLPVAGRQEAEYPRAVSQHPRTRWSITPVSLSFGGGGGGLVCSVVGFCSGFLELPASWATFRAREHIRPRLDDPIEPAAGQVPDNTVAGALAFRRGDRTRHGRKVRERRGEVERSVASDYVHTGTEGVMLAVASVSRCRLIWTTCLPPPKISKKGVMMKRAQPAGLDGR